MNQPLTREQRIARIQEECRREAEEARERRLACHDITNASGNTRRTW